MPRNKSSPKGITESAAVNPISIGWALSVADHLSFRGAARELGVRQTAVSRRVGALENALGVSLFERGPRGLKITTAGFRFIRDVREGFRYIEHATRMAGAAGLGKSGRLSIGIQPSMGAGFFRELFRAYSDQNPGVIFDWAEGAPPTEHVSLVERRLLDLAIVSDTTEVGGCEAVTLWTERLFVALPDGHFLAKRGSVGWQDLRGERFIIREAKCDPALCERVTRHVSERNRSPIIHKVNVGRETVMHLVALGQGVSLTTEATLATTYPSVIFRPITGGDETVQFRAVWLSGTANPALTTFLRLARSLAKQQRRERNASPRNHRVGPTPGGIILPLPSLGALSRRLGLST
jgi:DNA-binding transcriptional LysR family regulator